jgi:hypothetical protein
LVLAVMVGIHVFMMVVSVDISTTLDAVGAVVL